ncbi:flavin reductase family protein [Lentzea sp. NBRC 105346]|uniref:flavin reductase family protein n=1 Tax=Lentzea sp. NBRC 105346 TaxID=3032205 RepID=UPI00255670CA|nr:flavin reductase family protein [Lentzea sp. NBRC 105346]
MDADTFRHAMAQLAAPLTVLTCYAPDGGLIGLTVNAVCSVSARPPLVAVCLNRTNYSHDFVVSAERVCLHVLEPGQQELAFRFAKPIDRFAGQNVRHGAVPELTDVRLRIICAPDGVRDGGDHTILLGRVVEVTSPEEGDAGGLVWHRRAPHPLSW